MLLSGGLAWPRQHPGARWSCNLRHLRIQWLSSLRGQFNNADTIDKLFTILKDAYTGKGDFEQKADTVNVTYHAQMGYPTTFFIDVSQTIADEEQGYTVTNLIAR